jgi:hypothetical protein
MSKRHYLFTSAEHETIRFDFSFKTIEKFKELWNEGASHNKICKDAQINKYEMVLIVMDLDYKGELPMRKGGFWGEMQQ